MDEVKSTSKEADLEEGGIPNSDTDRSQVSMNETRKIGRQG